MLGESAGDAFLRRERAQRGLRIAERDAVLVVPRDVERLPVAIEPERPAAYVKFESMVLGSFMDSMMPKDADSAYGGGMAGGMWKSMRLMIVCSVAEMMRGPPGVRCSCTAGAGWGAPARPSGAG